jgi:hypothetical protein
MFVAKINFVLKPFGKVKEMRGSYSPNTPISPAYIKSRILNFLHFYRRKDGFMVSPHPGVRVWGRPVS